MIIKKLIHKLFEMKNVNRLMNFFRKNLNHPYYTKYNYNNMIGFHGDQYLLNILNFFFLKCKNFIETGTNVGKTLKYVADGYKHLNLYSCELDKEFYLKAKENLNKFSNCNIFNESSQYFLNKIFDTYNLKKDLNFFYLDAHGWGYKWNLKNEIKIITNKLKKAIILIDDFKVPNNSNFIYGCYDNKKCDKNAIKNELNLKRNYLFIYPKYKIKTSNYKRFVGYIIILMGINLKNINIPFQLFENYIISYKF